MKLLTALVLSGALAGCALDTADESDSLSIGGFGPASFPATLMSAYASTAAGVSVSWTEHGGNALTLFQRQTYDIAGNPLGNWQEISRWTNVPAGPRTYFDPARSMVGGRAFGAPLFLPDTQVGYRIVELPAGFTSCVGTTVGTCGYTSTLAYMPKATNYGVARAQLVVKTTQATANANEATLHVRAELNPFSETWLDSTNTDFRPSSTPVSYDLSTDYMNGLQDLQYIDLWTPDADGICVGEVKLVIDNNPIFDQQFPSCVWVMNGSSLHVPFAGIRTNATWSTYAPDTFLAESPPLTFIGYNSAGLAAHLDSIVGSQLRNYNSDAGPTAHLGAATTLTRKDAGHMHVQQHLLGLPYVVNANPSYDLVIHDDDATCSGWCVHVENFDGGASYSSGLTEWFVDTNLFADLIEHEVNDSLADRFNEDPTALVPPQLFTWCFPSPNAAGTRSDPKVGFNKTNQNHPVVWDSGSLTLCQSFTPTP